jgi:hypothetical protein
MTKIRDKKEYSYLLHLYSKVDDFLTINGKKEGVLLDVIVSFCVVVERIFKIKLHEENPVLLFDVSKMKDNGALSAILKGKEKDVNTIKIGETLERFNLMFPSALTEGESQALSEIYSIRNCLIHGYKSDISVLFSEDDIIKKMGTIWEKVSSQAQLLFGGESIKTSKPKEKYTEEELENVLIEEVRKKIKSIKKWDKFYFNSNNGVLRPIGDHNGLIYPRYNSSGSFLLSDSCPRCHSLSFSLDVENSNIVPIRDTVSISLKSIYDGVMFSDLYKCKDCGLELTRREYDIAKKLI